MAGRNYFKHVVSFLILIIAYQSYTMGLTWWGALLGALVTWLLVRFGGRIVQDRHYDHAENEWDKNSSSVIMGGEEDDFRGDDTSSDKTGSTSEDQ